MPLNLHVYLRGKEFEEFDAGALLIHPIVVLVKYLLGFDCMGVDRRTFLECMDLDFPCLHKHVIGIIIGARDNVDYLVWNRRGEENTHWDLTDITIADTIAGEGYTSVIV